VRTYKLTVRRRGRVERERAASLPEALARLRGRVEELIREERPRPERGLGREYAPIEQVAIRAEVAGRGAHGGVDVRGDGSEEAYTGRWRRVLVERRAGESAFEALGRALTEGT
jgi:hypothetical protein